MSQATTPVGKYTSDDRLPTIVGGDAQVQIHQMRNRIAARYRLVAVPGRPEELRQSDGIPSLHPDLRVSLGYGCRTIRVRTQRGHEWLKTVDFQIEDGWAARLYELLDPHFGVVTPLTVTSGRTPVKLI